MEEKKLTDEELKQAFFILRHGSSEGLSEYIKAVLAIESEYDRQKAEIERLTEERDVYLDDCSAVRHKLRQEIEEKFELQKQVDELTAFKTEAISMSLYGKGRKDGEEVAVKDTAKEIYEILEKWAWKLKNEKGSLGHFRFAIETAMQEIKQKYSLEVRDFKLVELKKGKGNEKV